MKLSKKVFIILIASSLFISGCADNKAVYTLDTLGAKIENIGEYSSRNFKIGNENSLNLWYAGVKTDDDLFYDECDYYIFDNNRSASKAFKYMKKNWIDTETDSGTDFVHGWEKGVSDASVEIYIQLAENMIIITHVQVTSEWGTHEGEDETDTSAKTNPKRIDFIKNNF